MSVRAPSFSTKQGAISAAMTLSLIRTPCSMSSAKTARRAEPTRVTSQPCAKSRISALVYSRATVASVPSTDTSLVLEFAQAGLIAGTVPDKRQRKFPPQFLQRERGRRVAGEHDQVRLELSDQAADHADHAVRQVAFLPVAIGEGGVIGGIDIARVRPHRGHLAIDGEAAKAGIENQNGRCVAHGLCPWA